MEKEPSQTSANALTEPEWPFLFRAQIRMSHDAQQRIAEAQDEFLGAWSTIDSISVQRDVPFQRVCIRCQSL
jgi:hypothetical protein